MVNRLKDPDAPVPNLRFKRLPNGRPEPGRFLGRNADGSVELVVQKDGSRRSVLAERVEFKEFGPRGGELWVSAEEAERPMPPE